MSTEGISDLANKIQYVVYQCVCLAVFCFVGSDALPLVDMYGLEGLREIINCTLKIDKCHMFHKVRLSDNSSFYFAT